MSSRFNLSARRLAIALRLSALGCGFAACDDTSGSPRADVALHDGVDTDDAAVPSTPGFTAHVADFPVDGLAPGELALPTSPCRRSSGSSRSTTRATSSCG